MPKSRSSPSPSTLTRGIFTRRRSELFLHRTRSGLARSDPDPRHRHQNPLLHLPPIQPTTMQHLKQLRSSTISIKDLRARRVFSPPSTSAVCSPDPASKAEASGNEPIPMDLMIGPPEKEDSVQSTPPDSDLMSKGGETLDFAKSKGSGNGGRDPEVYAGSQAKNRLGLAPCSRSKLYRNPSSFSYRRLLPYLMDLAKDESSGTEIAYSKTHSMEVEKNMEEKPVSSPGEPVSAQQLFNGGGAETTHSENHLMEVEKNMEEEPVLSPEESLAIQQHEILDLGASPTVNFEESPVSEKSSSISHDDDVDHNPMMTEAPSLCSESTLSCDIPLESSNVDGSESSAQVHGLNCEIPLESSNIGCRESTAQVDGFTCDLPLESFNIESEVLSNASLCSPPIREDLSVDEMAGCAKALSNFHGKAKEGCTTAVLKPDKEGKTLIGVSQIGAGNHGEPVGRRGNHALAPRKGIMKRQTRGCKGICFCLDCNSFRLHAEKAYEFSRKQMQEADEVVLCLVNELSCLRNLMEKSVEPVIDGARNNAIQINQEQVKGVCERAFKVEEVAKNQLRQMFQDLNAHCRIPGPRVTFAEQVEARSTS